MQDNESDYYNRYRNRAQGGFRWWLPSSHPDSSERLTDFRRPYEYAIVTSFNREQVRHRGSGIFLHVNGRGATAGCVSAPRWLLRYLVRVLDPDRRPGHRRRSLIAGRGGRAAIRQRIHRALLRWAVADELGVLDQRLPNALVTTNVLT